MKATRVFGGFVNVTCDDTYTVRPESAISRRSVPGGFALHTTLQAVVIADRLLREAWSSAPTNSVAPSRTTFTWRIAPSFTGPGGVRLQRKPPDAASNARISSGCDARYNNTYARPFPTAKNSALSIWLITTDHCCVPVAASSARRVTFRGFTPPKPSAT